MYSSVKNKNSLSFLFAEPQQFLFKILRLYKLKALLAATLKHEYCIALVHR